MKQQIWNGDSRDLAHKIEGPINCICTDPPYGMAFKSAQALTPKGKRWVEELENDGDLDEAIELFTTVMNILIPKCAEQAEMYVFTRWSLIAPWMDAVQALPDFDVKNLLVWDKGTPGMGDVRANWPYSWEAIIYAKKGRRPIPKRRSSVISVIRPDKDNHIHPTEKPVQLLETLLEMSTDQDDLVVDPFSGSGSTIHAARNLNRRAIGIELKENFHARSLTRLTQAVFDL